MSKKKVEFWKILIITLCIAALWAAAAMFGIATEVILIAMQILLAVVQGKGRQLR